jgi:hypothetical protein
MDFSIEGDVCRSELAPGGDPTKNFRTPRGIRR